MWALDFLSPPQEDMGLGLKTEFWRIFKVLFAGKLGNDLGLAMKYYSGDSLDHSRGDVT